MGTPISLLSYVYIILCLMIMIGALGNINRMHRGSMHLRGLINASIATGAFASSVFAAGGATPSLSECFFVTGLSLHFWAMRFKPEWLQGSALRRLNVE